MNNDPVVKEVPVAETPVPETSNPNNPAGDPPPDATPMAMDAGSPMGPNDGDSQPPSPVQTPFMLLQNARARLNAALGSIEGADLAIGKSQEHVEELEFELRRAQENVNYALQDALGHRQALHNACDSTEAAIRLLRDKYPLN